MRHKQIRFQISGADLQVISGTAKIKFDLGNQYKVVNAFVTSIYARKVSR